MNAIAPEIQRLEHKKRMLEEQLKIKERAIHALENEAGKIRCQIQNADNALYTILTKRCA